MADKNLPVMLRHALPPKPPVALPLPPAPPTSSSVAAFHSANPQLKRHVRMKKGRLQYRDDPAETWTHVEESYESIDDKEEMPEPWNVEQVYFRRDSIEVSQFNEQYSGKDPKLFVDAASLFRWKVTFAGLRDVFVSERNLGVREGNKKPLVICVVRFKCSSIVGIEDNRLPEDPEDNEAMETTAEDQEEGGEENGGDSVIATGEGSEHDGEEMEVDAPPNPSSFPLAMLSSSAEGKEFRIAVVRTNIGFKAGRLNPYGWTWPGVVRFLSNLEWSHNLKENYEEPLNTWAIRNKDLLRTVHLVEIPPTPENGIEFSEWALQKIEQGPLQLTFPTALPGTALRLPSMEVAILPSAGPGLPQPTTTAPPASIPPTISGSKRKYEKMDQSAEAIRQDIARLKALKHQQDGELEEATLVQQEAIARREAAAKRFRDTSDRLLELYDDLERAAVSEESNKKSRTGA